MCKTNEKSMFASPKFLCVKYKQTMCAYHMKNCVLSVANIPHEKTRDMHMTVLTVCGLLSLLILWFTNSQTCCIN